MSSHTTGQGSLQGPKLGLPSGTETLSPQYTPSLSHDFLKYERHPLDAIFEPKSVAVIGATGKAGSVGRTILWNLISSPFGGTVYPVNAKRGSVLGIKAYP